MQRPLIDFDWSPISGPVGFTIGSDTFPPTADARFAAEETPVNTLISFTALTTALPHQQFIYFDWDFGDGEQGHGPTVKHTFPIRTPEAQVVLTIRDQQNRTFRRTKMVNLHSHDPIFLIIHDPLIPE